MSSARDGLRQHWPLWLGVALILLVNVIVLAGAGWNRSGEPGSLLVLGERELVDPYGNYHSSENSGMALRIDWRMAGSSGRWHYPGLPDQDPDAHNWLTEEKMTALGFTPYLRRGSKYADAYWNNADRELFVVLELDGPAWQQALAAARAELATAEAHAGAIADEKTAEQLKLAREQLQSEEQRASRLFAIDAGLDPQALRAQYPDRSRYAVVRGRILPFMKDTPQGQQLRGYISELGVATVHVPVQFQQPLRGTVAAPAARRYRATLAWGRRFEPWLVDLQGLPASPVPQQ